MVFGLLCEAVLLAIKAGLLFDEVWLVTVLVAEEVGVCPFKIVIVSKDGCKKGATDIGGSACCFGACILATKPIQLERRPIRSPPSQ